ncbi:hypothetical protein EV361DRAFT_954677 [Lentinula raphanica]|nr:hypothetical protein EV361DRAFT_954677 [Lentinula raphanica]
MTLSDIKPIRDYFVAITAFYTKTPGHRLCLAACWVTGTVLLFAHQLYATPGLASVNATVPLSSPTPQHKKETQKGRKRGSREGSERREETPLGRRPRKRFRDVMIPQRFRDDAAGNDHSDPTPKETIPRPDDSIPRRDDSITRIPEVSDGIREKRGGVQGEKEASEAPESLRKLHWVDAQGNDSACDDHSDPSPKETIPRRNDDSQFYSMT